MIKDLRMRVVELGKIKIGRKSERTTGTGFRLPEKLDHFLVTTLARDARGDLVVDAPLMARLAEQQGCTPDTVRELPIALLADDPDEVFPTAYVAYRGKTRLATSDGETITWFCDPRTGQPLAQPHEARNEHDYVQTATYQQGSAQVRVFKPHGTLSCVLACGESRFGGVYKLRTTSLITIEQIVSGLRYIRTLTRGFLRNVPLRLAMRPMQVAPDGKPTTVYVCHIEMHGADLTAIQQRVVEAAKLEMAAGTSLVETRRAYVALLNAPGDAGESPAEQAEVAEEFSPETVEMVDPQTGEVTSVPVQSTALEPSVAVVPPTPKAPRKKKEQPTVPAAVVPPPVPESALPQDPPPPDDSNAPPEQEPVPASVAPAPPAAPSAGRSPMIEALAGRIRTAPDRKARQAVLQDIQNGVVDGKIKAPDREFLMGVYNEPRG